MSRWSRLLLLVSLRSTHSFMPVTTRLSPKRQVTSFASPPPKKKSRIVTPPPAAKAPKDWESIYSLVEELRKDRTAPCDHLGCEALAQGASPKDQRFVALVSLMLSSQTKDAVVAQAIANLREAGALTVEGMHALTPEELNAHIRSVGFHNNKTKYLRQATSLLLEHYEGDIPPTAQAMMELPGVGPKMAYICENVAWGRQTGIGVDTHMHRLFALLGWTMNAKTPEQTRLQLEAWLPHEYWASVNLLWVGFGQEVQQEKSKVLRKALDCSRPYEALKLLKRCGLDYKKEAVKEGCIEEVDAVLKKGSN